MPFGTEKNTLMGAAGAMPKNYFGDESDGTVTTSGNLTYTVPSKNGSYDGDMYVANYINFTVSAGHTVTVDQPCRGLLLYCSGDLTVNGTLSMSGKGAFADPTTSGGSDSGTVGVNGIQLGMFDGSGSATFTNDGVGFSGCGTPARTAVANQGDLNGNGTVYSVSRDGAAGDTGASTSCNEQCRVSGSIGGSGTTGGATLSTGGGGSGGAWAHAQNPTSTGGNGAKGGCFSGGSGGGARIGVGGQSGSGGSGVDYGGAGGNAVESSSISGAYSAGGGAGNPGGTGKSFQNGSEPTAQDGVGGMMWVIVKGDVTVATGASITCAGILGAECDNNGGGCGSSGGSSGGGALFILYGGTLTNSGTITATGGPGETSHNTSSANDCGAGGPGGSHTAGINK